MFSVALNVLFVICLGHLLVDILLLFLRLLYAVTASHFGQKCDLNVIS